MTFSVVSSSSRSRVRSPVDVLRLVLGLLTIAVGILVALAFDRALLGLRDDGASALSGLPDWTSNLPAAALAVSLVGGISAVVGWTIVTHRYRRLSLITIAVIAAAGLSTLAGLALDSLMDMDVRQAFIMDGEVVDQVFLRPTKSFGGQLRVIPGDPLFAAAIAVLGVASSWMRRRYTRQLTKILVAYAALSTLTAAVPALGLVIDTGIGLCVAATILLVTKRFDLAPNRDEITAALASIAIPIKNLETLDVDARGSVPWIASTGSGQRMFIKSLGRDERSADLLFRTYRKLRIRRSGDSRPFASLQQAVEHEALVSLHAAALGIPTPPMLGLSNAGIGGVVLAYEAIEGCSADQLDDLSDEILQEVWQMVAELHRHRIAHRDLRLANLFIDTDNKPWMVDFGFAELAASDQLLSTDIAELLASTAAIVGVERSVNAACAQISKEAMASAIPWMQPLALSAASGNGMGGDSGLKELREALHERAGIEPEDPVVLDRINTKTLFIIGTLALSAWFLLPQIASIGDLWEQIEDASILWTLAATGFSLVTYFGATVALVGAVPCPVPFRGAFAAQMASSFANRVTPAKVGGLATNVRYFQRQGIPLPVALSAVGMNGIAGLIIHIAMSLMFLVIAGQNDSQLPVGLPSLALLTSILAGVLLVTAVTFALPWGRKLFTERIRPQLKAGGEAIRDISTRPAKLSALLGGSAIVTSAYLATMVASLHAFGSTASLPLVGLLFLTGSAIASAAPTPGGLGAAEAALIAALSTIEQAEIVVPAVFLFRFATFWLPILPGWLFLSALKRSGDL